MKLNGKIIRFEGNFAVIETDSQESHLKVMHLRRGYDVPPMAKVGDEVALSYMKTPSASFWTASMKKGE